MIDQAKNPSQHGDTSGRTDRFISGPAVRDTRRSHVEEQYPILLRNNRLRASDLLRLREEASTFTYKPLVSIMMLLLNPKRERLERTLDSLIRQLYPNWELLVVCCEEESAERGTKELFSRYERLDRRIKVAYAGRNARGGVAGQANAAASLARGEFACLLGQGDELAQDALYEVAKLLQLHPEEVDLIYTDEDTIDEEGNRSEPRFKPGWSPDLLLSTNYISQLSVYRRSLLEEVGGFRVGLEGYEDYDLLLRLTERTERIHHIPKVLYHRRASNVAAAFAYGDEPRTRDGARRALSEALERRGMEGFVEDGLLPETFRTRPKIKGEPKVSIIIPTRNHAHLLKSCIESIERLTTYRNYEILIVDNDSTEPATLEYLASTPHRVIPFREEYNHPKINNLATSQAEGEYVLLLNDDTEVIDGGWLEAMLEHAQRPEVGAVGAKLLYPDGRIQHAGVVTKASVWTRGVATHAYQFYSSDSPGYMGTLATTTNYNAVTAACMLLRKSVFEEVGGLDEKLRVSFDDVDLCLRIRERGYLVVYTPYAELYHYESVTLGRGVDHASEVYMTERWERMLDKDLYYNPHFSKSSGDFNLRADLMRPRVLRQVRTPEDPASSPDGRLLTGPEVLRMNSEEIDKYLKVQRKATRDSCRTTIVPRAGAGTVETALMESLENEKPFVPQKGEQAHETEDPRLRKSPRAEQLVWMFGSPRTGSTWLSRMMAEFENQERWNEPYIGLLFGSFLHERLDGNTKLLSNPSFILSEPHREVWLRSVKNFVLEGARARYSNLRDDQYLIVKEPNGSLGASLLMEAMPESRMIFLIRDSRDVIASRLDATRKGSWTVQNRDFDTPEKINAFTEHLAEDYLRVVSQVQKAYDVHLGKKAFVRYEDLRGDTLGTLKTMYGDLGIEVDESRLEAAVEKHSWEQIPDSDKGLGKVYRKAQPGSWREDLSPEQITIIEKITGPVLSKYY
jgi:O-antigen biosynthesis protein